MVDWRDLFAAFRNATADVKNGVVLFGDKAWGNSCFATLLCAGAQIRTPEFFAIEGRLARIERQREEAALEIWQPVMMCCSWASLANHGHWLMNSLLSIYLVRDELKSGRLRLLCPSLSARQRQEILQLDVPADAIFETEARFVRCDWLVYPSPLTTRANVNSSSLSREFFGFIKEKCSIATEKTAPDYVFLTRKGFPSARQMLNEDELIAALAVLGFTCVAPHTAPPDRGEGRKRIGTDIAQCVSCPRNPPAIPVIPRNSCPRNPT